MQLIRKLILLLLLFPSLALSQIDIPVQTLGNYFSAGQNLKWGASGTGGFNNNFILPGLGGITTNMCVFVQNNNPSVAHSFNFKAYVTSSPILNSFTGNSGPWSPLEVDSSILFQGNQWAASGNTTGGPTPFLVKGATGAKIALSFSGSTSSSGDTASIYGMYTFGNTCSMSLAGGASFEYYNPTITANPTPIFLFGNGTGSLFYGDPSKFSGCTFTALIANNSGTTPTMNVYIQDYDRTSLKGSDRVSFIQATTTASSQQVSFVPSGTVAPYAITDKGLAAGSVINSPFSNEIVLNWTLGGTSPSYSLDLIGHCQ